MGVRALPRNNERLVWRTPKEPRKRERGTAWQFHFKLPLAFVEPRLVFGSNRQGLRHLQFVASASKPMRQRMFENRLLIGTNI